jgi:large subunit ribosomal protein L15
MRIDGSELAPDPGATHAKKRVGRGNGSGHGTYSGKGLKGQKSRSGKSVGLHFEGGQAPLARKLHVLRGFNNKWRTEYQPVNLASLERFEEGSTVTPETLRAAGVVRSLRNPVKILGEGSISKKLDIHAHRFSEVAKAKIEEAGGTATALTPPKAEPASKDEAPSS